MNDLEIAKKYFFEGLAFLEADNFSEAEDRFLKSNKLIPERSSTLTNLSVAQIKLKKYSEAKIAAKKAILLEKNNSEAYLNLGLIEKELKNMQLAISYFNKSLDIKPDYVEAWSNKGITLYELKRFDEALVQFNKALDIKPDYVEAWSNKGNTLHELKRFDEALAHYNKALTLKPDYVEAWFNKGLVLKDLTRAFEARTSFDKALEYKPEFHKARWAKLFTSIPNISPSQENLDELRSQFSKEIDQLEEWLSGYRLDDFYEVIGSSQPFYLAYQEQKNKGLLHKYGLLCHRAMYHWQKIHQLKSCTINNGKIKIGIVSDHIRKHSVWYAIIKGLLLKIDKNKFEIHILYLGDLYDEETEVAKLNATSFSSNKTSLLSWAHTILEKNIEVLIYPEIGMHQLTTQLANLRLSPIQMAFWGHPETSGLPTIDYYLSGELFETESAHDAYTETLINLPSLGCSYSRLNINPKDFDIQNLGMESGTPILLCPGTLFKYTPEHDRIFVDIAKRLGSCKFIFFIQQKNWAYILRMRLKSAFDESNLAIDDYVIFLPWLKPDEFYGLMKHADIFLDTIGFSGFNTAMQAVDCGLPIVTIEGKFMRGRLASGILKKMEMSELVADNDDEYIEIAVRLVQNVNYRNQIIEKMIKMRNLLYDDPEPIRVLEDFLLKNCRELDCIK